MEREEVRNRRLRRADWRFLLPDPSPRVSLCFERGALYDAVVRISTAVAIADPVPLHGCDLAVSTDPDPMRLRAAFTRLRPGGACYVECHGLSVRSAAVRHTLLDAGFHDVRTYWPWPSADRCRAWIPLDDPAVASAYLREEGQAAHGPLRRLVRASRRGIWRLRQRLGLTLHVSAIGVKRPGDDGDLPRGILDIIRANWTAWDLAPASPSRLSCVMQTGGPRSSSKVVALVFADEASAPALAVKIARVPEAAAGLTREADTLGMVHGARVPPLHGVPRVLFAWRDVDVLAIGETALPGAPITGRLARRHHAALAAAGTSWLIDLAHATQAPSGVSGELSAAAWRRFAATYGGAASDAVPRAIDRAFARLATMPSVCEHRDFSPWNVFVQHVDDLSVLDWESSTPRGIPGLDLIYFLSYLAFYRDGLLGWRSRELSVARFREAYRTAWDPRTPAGRVNHGCTTTYAARVGIDPAACHALRLLTWLMHAESEYQRLAADLGSTPPPALLRRRGLFLNLLEEEARIGVSSP